MEKFLTIRQFAESSFVEKKSEFIGSIAHIENPDDAEKFIDEIKNIHKAAKHYVYVYTCRKNNILRYSDDGEPQGKAAIPALEVIKANNLCDICLVITRYFGGILLGGGGLARAYSRSATDAIKKAEVVEMTPCLSGILECNYSLSDKILYFFRNNNVRIKNIDYSDIVKINFEIRSEDKEIISKKIIEISSGKVKFDFASEYFSPFPIQ